MNFPRRNTGVNEGLWLAHPDRAVGALVPALILVHLFCSPYTKVEESFNIQAIHDILTYGVSLENPKERLVKRYDHFAFPGSVPRTFVGALAVSGFSAPFVGVLQRPELAQTFVRGTVGMFNAFALLAFQDAVSSSFGRVAGYWYVILQCSQFHVMYYASRTLPNSFAFGLSTLAFRYFMLSNFGPRPRRARRNRLAIYILTIAGVIFRAELGLLVVIQAAWLFLFRRVSIRHVILPAGVAAMSIGLLVTVAIDSFFWQSFPLWPEWVAFRFNTLSGKSSEWGTSPWHFYLTSSIPKLILNPFVLFVCLPLALADRLNRRFSIDTIGPHVLFVACYSLLPHKEWRFVMYIVPSLTAVSSAGAAWIWNRRRRSFRFRFLALALLASTLATYIASLCLLLISSLNYPGATALVRLHELVGQGTPERAMVRVHLDNLSCQTGVTRFLQRPVPAPREGTDWVGQPVWYYDKTDEGQKLLNAEFWERFDYALAEDAKKVTGHWEVLETIPGFAGIALVQRDKVGASRIVSDGHMSKPLAGLFLVVWSRLENWARFTLTRGWWPEVKMDPKISILRKIE